MKKPSLLAAIRERIDGWINPLTGFGTERDRSTHSSFVRDTPLDTEELAALYHNDGFAKKIAEALPKTALFQGIVVESEDNEAETIVAKKLEKLSALEAVQLGRVWGRVFGGGIIVLGVDDGRPVTEPLDV